MIVEADPGQIGGGVNHEFMARASVGEDLFVECENGDYLADTEAARPMAPESAGEGTEPLIEIDTPNTPTIESLAALVGRRAGEDAEVRDVRRGGESVAGPRAG